MPSVGIIDDTSNIAVRIKLSAYVHLSENTNCGVAKISKHSSLTDGQFIPCSHFYAVCVNTHLISGMTDDRKVNKGRAVNYGVWPITAAKS